MRNMSERPSAESAAGSVQFDAIGCRRSRNRRELRNLASDNGPDTT
ncbi:hypothetical protein C7S14_2546 [Burkholderia cepacia]|nr:hypothetical protein C7S14_2546 [Burkholderia cepacia]